MFLVKKKQNSQRPPVGGQVQWGHPLANGLVAAYLCNEAGGLTMFNAVGNHHAVMQNIPTSGQGGAWQAVGGPPKVAGIGTNWANNFPGGPGLVTPDTTFGSPNAVTIVAQAYPFSDIGHFNYIVQWGGTVGSDGGAVSLEFDFENLNAGIDGYVYLGSGNDSHCTYGAVGDFNRRNCHVVYVADPNGQGQILYLDGIQVASVFPNTPIDWVDSGVQTFFGSGATSVISQILLYNRALSAGEAQWLFVEPYAMLMRGRSRIPAVPAGVSSVDTINYGAQYRLK